MDGLYQELGAAPTDSQAELQRRYRQRARELHPDVNRDRGAEEAMRRLNHAWSVLGDPEARRRYDGQLLGRVAGCAPEPSAAPRPAAPRPGSDDQPVFAPRWMRLLRPSVVIPLVLFAIFIATAYAGRAGPGPPPPASPPTSSTPTVLGQCARRQAVALAIVPCSGPNGGQVTAIVSLLTQCPAGTTGAPLPGLATMVACLKSPAP